MKSDTGLCDVPETMLWTLYNRAHEARKLHGIIQDPKCLEIFGAVDYDFEANFGKNDPTHAVRSLVFDEQVRSFARSHPSGVIVNLGEGLETQRYRVDTGDGIDWYCVDLPESIRVRERFIAPDDRHHHLAKSALDHSWFDCVPEDRPVFVTAQGLLMYFEKSKVEELIRAMSSRWPGMWLMFDHIPPWLSRKTMSDQGYQLTPKYRAPGMPWSIRPSEVEPFLRRCAGEIEGYEALFRGAMRHFPRGIRRFAFSTAIVLPGVRNSAPGIAKARLLGRPQAE